MNVSFIAALHAMEKSTNLAMQLIFSLLNEDIKNFARLQI